MVHEPPLLNPNTRMNFIAPDSQIGRDGTLYKLDSELDDSDQESLMKVDLQFLFDSFLRRRSFGNASEVDRWIVLWKSLSVINASGLLLV